MRKLKKSNIPGFHKLNTEKRIEIVKKFAGLSEEEINLLKKTAKLDLQTANIMIENVIGTLELPFGIATNFLINGKDYLIPMVLEEPSVVAAASYAAKLARPSGGFKTSSSEPIMTGQIQLIGIKNFELAKEKILENKKEIIKIASEKSGMLKYGGGAKDLEINIINTIRGRMLIVNLFIDVCNAMGANIVNTTCEGVAPFIEKLVSGKARLKVLSNLAAKRIARAKVVWSKDVIGKKIIEGILDAYAFAVADQHRCTTHNKGIMNSVDAVALATGQDFRAIESACHSYAALNGYKPLTRYEKDKEGNLIGKIELPIPVGVIGGSIKTNPIAKIALKILGVSSSRELAEVMAAVGLANNFSALRALATEGIQKGHLRLHSRNIAVMAGAKGKMIDKVAEQMVKSGKIGVNEAKRILQKLRKV